MKVDATNVLELWELSHQYFLQGIFQECENFLVKEMQPEAVPMIVKLSILYESPRVFAKCLQLMKEHMAVMVLQTEYWTLSEEEQRQFLGLVIEHEDISVTRDILIELKRLHDEMKLGESWITEKKAILSDITAIEDDVVEQADMREQRVETIKREIFRLEDLNDLIKQVKKLSAAYCSSVLRTFDFILFGEEQDER